MLEKDIKILIEKIDKLSYNLNKNKFIDLIEVMGNKKEMIFRNLFSGLWKGIGIGIGVTLVTAIIILICLLYTSPSPRDRTRSRMPSSA